MTSVTSVAAAPAQAPLSKLPSLTGLRWIAAMLVFGFHVGTMGFINQSQTQTAVSWLFTLGLSGVQFFFILSGFVLVWSARPGDTRRAFWWRRAAKIFPNHILLWAVALLLGAYWAQPFELRIALPNLLLLQAWDPFAFYTVNNVSWSLSCELFFYLCLPLALPTIRRMPSWLLWSVVVAVPLLILSLWPAQLLVPETHRWWFTQIFPPVRSLEFWMGVAAAELMLRGRWRGPGLRLATVIFVATWLVCAQWIPAQWWAALLAAAYILVIAAAAEADVRALPSPWRSRPLIWLGEVSFAFYLLHVLVIGAVLRFLGRADGLPGWWGPLAAIGFLLLNLLLAGLMHRYVETPMMRLLTRRQRRARPVAPAEGGTAPAGDRTAPVVGGRVVPAGDAVGPVRGGVGPAGPPPGLPGRQRDGRDRNSARPERDSARAGDRRTEAAGRREGR